MHHLYPLAKGDPLCPLGFHPQVRWPTRCKRCFRDYKEHGGKRKDDSTLRRDDTTASTPSLSLNSRENDSERKRSWVSSSNLTYDQDNSTNSESNFSNPSSWTSTPDLANLEDNTQAVSTTVNIKLPKRKQKPIDFGQRTVSDSFSVMKMDKSTVFNKSDSLATRAKKLQALKESSENRVKRIQIKEVKTISEEPTNHDVQFLIQVKRKPLPTTITTKTTIDENLENDDDSASTAGTETTDTTLVDAHDNELREQIESLKNELDVTKSKCERLEREKSDILLRRLAAMETTTSKTTASEVLKLQQKCNDLQQQLEDYRDEKKSLTLRIKELEDDLEHRPTAQEAQKVTDELRSKLLAAETLCEELMDENEDIKKELRDMEEQMDEMQDNFREDQAVEYTSIKKELDQTTKNCRILSFKLRKAERKAEQLDQEKNETEKKLKEISGGQSMLGNLEKVKQLEQDLKLSNEVSKRLQKELDDANEKLNQAEETTKITSRKKAPMLGSIGKFPSADGKVSRESLTRGGSQDDPAQLLRDLQDSMEREADLREQLKFAEEEAQDLRKKVSRIEDDNESLVLQLKKMATTARSRKLSPTNNKRLTSEEISEKGNIPSEEDPAEIMLQLELSEQEVFVLRRKVEDLEAENHRIKAKNKELQDKLLTKKSNTRKPITSRNNQDDKDNNLQNQKLKVLEDEVNDLRKKLIEKERDCDRLQTELSLNQKRSKNVQKNKSLDLDQPTVDLKRQLQIIEQEAIILRTKVQSLESDNEKLVGENKKLQLLRNTRTSKSDKDLNKYIDQIAALEIEIGEKDFKIKELEDIRKLSKNSTLCDLKDGKYKRFVERTPKKISNLTSKDQLKIMVNDLENEIGEMIVAIKTSENEKINLEEEVKKIRQTEISKTTEELEAINKRFGQVKQELAEEKEKLNQEKSKNDDLNRTLAKTKESLTKSNLEKKKLKEQIDKWKEEEERLQKEKQLLNNEITKLKSNLKDATYKQDELALLCQKTDTLKLNLDMKDKEIKTMQKQLDEKTEIVKNLTEETNKLTEIDKKYKEEEDKFKKSEKQRREKIKELESKIEDERKKYKNIETDYTSLTSKWNEEREKYISQINELSSRVLCMETSIESKKKLVERLEENLKKEKETHLKNVKTGENENREITRLQEELNKEKINMRETENKLESTEKQRKNLEDKLKTLEAEHKNIKVNIERRCGELETELQNEKRKNEMIKTNYEKENKNKELELISLKSKIKTLELNSGIGMKGVSEIKQFQEIIEKLESNLNKEKQKYEELTAKYEILEEEHVVTKAKLVMEKETIESQLLNTKSEMHNIEKELKTLRETYNKQHDTWIKEKLDMHEKLKKLNRKNGNELEKTRLKVSLEERQSELDQLKKENEVINDQMEFMRKENDELRKKLDDYEKVNKVQRSISADSSAMEKEIKQLRAKINSLEKSKKLELGECKMRYDNQISIVNGELQQLQSQIMRFKRERDTYKHMLESAQKMIGDLKNSPKLAKDNSKSSLHYDELEESKTKIATLDQQISCMEDELSEARLEASRLKTELISERSTWEVRMSELHSRVNELEEEKILNSGRTKIVGLRTRMELAWQKEREEQQRLLQETATLARDLRQTLFEVERERDKERLEAKRKQEQFKKSSEEDQDENKRKITELQCDLLELRDAHAKLRTTNEKLRREKEKHEKEREELKAIVNSKRKFSQDDEKKLNYLIDQIDFLKQFSPELFLTEGETQCTPTPPRRTRSSNSRETSPSVEKGESSLTPENKSQQIRSVMLKLINAADNLRKFQQSWEDEYEKERIKRTMGMRRAMSIEQENVNKTRYSSNAYTKRRSTDGNLHRKSLSLEHTTVQNEQKIWKTDDSMSSLQSLEISSDVERWTHRDASLDSRLSGGSTQSELVGEKKKKKGIMGKLKKFTKSRSIDDQDPGTFPPARPLSSKPNSNSEINEEKGSKRDLRDRITGIFKKSGSSSRSNSVERHDTSSTHRPLMRNGSNGNISRTSPVESEKASKTISKKN